MNLVQLRREYVLNLNQCPKVDELLTSLGNVDDVDAHHITKWIAESQRRTTGEKRILETMLGWDCVKKYLPPKPKYKNGHHIRYTIFLGGTPYPDEDERHGIIVQVSVNGKSIHYSVGGCGSWIEESNILGFYGSSPYKTFGELEVGHKFLLLHEEQQKIRIKLHQVPMGANNINEFKPDWLPMNADVEDLGPIFDT